MKKETTNYGIYVTTGNKIDLADKVTQILRIVHIDTDPSVRVKALEALMEICQVKNVTIRDVTIDMNSGGDKK